MIALDLMGYRDQLQVKKEHGQQLIFDPIRRKWLVLQPEELVRQRRQAYDELRMRLEGALQEQTEDARHRLDRAKRSLALLSPRNQLRRAAERLAALRQRLYHGGGTIVESGRNRLRPILAQLQALSPLAILGRGYALALKLPERTLVRNATALAKADQLEVRVARGRITTTVTDIQEEENA